jgi:hypothetical protein
MLLCKSRKSRDGVVFFHLSTIIEIMHACQHACQKTIGLGDITCD